MSQLLILLGHKNDDYGILSTDARARCLRAIRWLRRCPQMKVLPTGAFGPDFNTSKVPHGMLLRRFLIQQGIERDRIWTHTNSANTIEDAHAAYALAKRAKITRAIVVTTSFHKARTIFIFGRVFHDIELHFSIAKTPATLESETEARERAKEEAKKLEELKDNWVFNYPSDSPNVFDIYQNASEEHKHYDNISLAIVSSMAIAFSAPFAIQLDPALKLASYFVAGFLIGILLILYHLMTRFARLARIIMRNIELSIGPLGFPSAYLGRHQLSKGYGIPRWVIAFGISRWVTVMAFFFEAALLLAIAAELMQVYATRC